MHTPPDTDIWAAIAAPLDPADVQWRQQGKPKARASGGFAAPFVAYVDSQLVRARLDAVVPGNWDFTIEALPPSSDENGVALVAFKGRLQIFGVIREDVGTGTDYKAAVSDTLKRCAVRFGVGHELYTDYEVVWVPVESDSKFAKPLDDPAAVFARKQGGTAPEFAPVAQPTTPSAAPQNVVTGNGTGGAVACPTCGGATWNNVAENNARAARGEKLRPDYACKNRSCGGVIWRKDDKKPSNGKAPVSIGAAPIGDDGEPAY